MAEVQHLTAISPLASAVKSLFKSEHSPVLLCGTLDPWIPEAASYRKRPETAFGFPFLFQRAPCRAFRKQHDVATTRTSEKRCNCFRCAHNYYLGAVCGDGHIGNMGNFIPTTGNGRNGCCFLAAAGPARVGGLLDLGFVKTVPLHQTLSPFPDYRCRSRGNGSIPLFRFDIFRSGFFGNPAGHLCTGGSVAGPQPRRRCRQAWLLNAVPWGRELPPSDVIPAGMEAGYVARAYRASPAPPTASRPRTPGTGPPRRGGFPRGGGWRPRLRDSR